VRREERGEERAAAGNNIETIYQREYDSTVNSLAYKVAVPAKSN